MKSPMIHQFSQVPQASIQRSTFMRSWGYKTTMDSGYLVPIYVDDALPGDTFQLKATLFGRFTTPIVPIMDNVYLETFFFAVPIRLVWNNFQKFMGEQENPGDSIDYLLPTIYRPGEGDEGFAIGSLADYFGIPTGVPNLRVTSIYHRAYNLVWNEWFRDENLQDSATVPKDDGPDDESLFPLRKRCKRRDYFTSCLPWPQKGPGVELPLGTTAPVITGPGLFGPDYANSAPLQWRTALSGSYYAPASSSRALIGVAAGDQVQTEKGLTFGRATDVQGTVSGSVVPASLYADLSKASAATINTLRQAFQVQRFMEAQARGGSRYIEQIRALFGVISPDARLQRPEYLGGGSDHIHFQPLAQTSSTDDVTPQGNLAAYGMVGGQHGFTKSFTEHCIIIGLANIRADLTYQQGVPRMFSRRTRFDFYWPQFAHLGEQAVLNKEIFAQGYSDAGIDPDAPSLTYFDDEVFGYQERYAEYRYYPSMITGKFRSSDPQSLDVWHLAQSFENLPKLNSEFIEENPPIKRILAVQDEPELLLDCLFNNKSTRPMPLYGVPGLIDHF